MIAYKNDPTRADQMPSMVTPGIHRATTRNARIWKTSTSSAVRMSEYGATMTRAVERMMALNRVMTMTAAIAAAAPLTEIPGISQAVTRKEIAATRMVATKRQI